MRNTVIYVSALIALATFCAGAAGAEPPAARPAAGAVTISAALHLPHVPVRVGEPLAIRVTIRNTTAAPIMLPDWEHFTDEVSLCAWYTAYPNQSGRPLETCGFWDIGALTSRDFRPLPPGEVEVVRTLTPVLPGKMHIMTAFHSPTDVLVSLTDGNQRRLDDGWAGSLVTDLLIDVPAEMSPEMVKRYGDVARRLADPLVPSDQKGRLLAIVADEKHYFAAQFIRRQCDTLPAGAMRDAAVWQLLKLAKVGPAYESIPQLLEWMVDPKTDQTIRVATLDWVADALARGTPTSIADQAWYAWPEALCKKARQAIQRLTMDRNPYLGARAKDALLRLEP